jgi:SAM-dependent methyltransferase
MSASVTPRGLLFGTAAESYERFRLGYPDEVVDRTLAYAGRPVRTAVEVGAGTGKATRAFVSRGVQVVALEPDPDMYAVLQRETVGMPVTPVLTTFEHYDGPRAGLVYAAAAWHWTDPATRWVHAADLLDEGGVLSMFGSQLRIADPDLESAARQAIGDQVEDSAFRPREEDRAPSIVGWRTEDIEGSGLFAGVESHELAREVVVSQKEYVGHLSTISAFLRLDLEDRQDVLRKVSALIPAQVRLDASVSLQLARRL